MEEKKVRELVAAALDRVDDKFNRVLQTVEVKFKTMQKTVRENTLEAVVEKF